MAAKPTLVLDNFKLKVAGKVIKQWDRISPASFNTISVDEVKQDMFWGAVCDNILTCAREDIVLE